MMLKLAGTYFSNQFKTSALRGPNKGKARLALIGLIALMIYLLVLVGGLCMTLAKQLYPLGMLHILPELVMMATSVLVLFSALFTSKALLFGYKDYDLLASMPVPSRTVAGSRILILYLYELFYSLIISLPAFAACILYGGADVYYIVAALLGCLLMPVIPIIVGSALGTVTALLASRFRGATVVRYVVLTLFALGIMYISISTSSFMSQSVGGMSDAVLSSVDTLAGTTRASLPWVALYSDALQGDILKLLIFVVLNVALFAGFSLLVGRFSAAITSRAGEIRTGRRYNLEAGKSSGAGAALLWREFKIYFGSPLYVFNTAFGMLLLLIGAVALAIFKDKVIASLGQDNMILLSNAVGMVPFLCACTITMCATSCSSISMEGTRFWITRTIPVPIFKVFMAKMGVNVLVTAIPSIVASTVLVLALDVNPELALWFYLTPLVYCCFTAVFGLFINLLLPKLDWKNEASVVKQSGAMLLGLLGGMGASLLPVIFQLTLGGLTLAVTTLAVAVISGLLLLWLKGRGVRRFNTIEG